MRAVGRAVRRVVRQLRCISLRLRRAYALSYLTDLSFVAKRGTYSVTRPAWWERGTTFAYEGDPGDAYDEVLHHLNTWMDEEFAKVGLCA